MFLALPLVALLITFCGFIVWRNFRPTSRRGVAWFAIQHRLTLTSDNGGLVIDYLARTQRWRFYGVSGALAATISWTILFPGRHNFNLLAVLFGGWFLGAILAEAPVGRRRRPGPRTASLLHRSLYSYVQPVVRVTLFVTFTITAVALTLWVARRPVGDLRTPATSTRESIVTGSVVAALVAAASIGGIWAVVRRPQPAAHPDIIEADNAVRIAAVTRIAAGWIVIESLINLALLINKPSRGNEAQLITTLIVASLGIVIWGWAWIPTRFVPRRDRVPRDGR